MCVDKFKNNSKIKSKRKWKEEEELPHTLLSLFTSGFAINVLLAWLSCQKFNQANIYVNKVI